MKGKISKKQFLILISGGVLAVILFSVVIFLLPSKEARLFRVVSNGDIKRVKEILRGEVNVSFRNPESSGETPLHAAARNGFVKIAALLLEKGADLSLEDRQGHTPLMEAVKDCSYHRYKYNMVILFVKKGAVINQPNRHGETALHFAAEGSAGDNLKIVKFLTGKGANIHAVTGYGSTPYMKAMREARRLEKPNYYHDQKKRKKVSAVIISLLQRKIDSELLRGAEKGNEILVRSSLKRGAHMETRDRYGNSPLYLSAMFGRDSIVRYLLSQNAVIDPVHVHNITPLHAAVKRGRLSTVKILVKAGADIHTRDRGSRQGLLISAVFFNNKRRIEMLRYLISAGIDVNAKNGFNWTALHVTALGNDLEEMKVLLDAGADMDVRSFRGFNALMKAAENASLETLKLLIERGADVNVTACDKKKYEYGRTPLMLAAGSYRKKKRVRALSFLIKAGARINMQDSRGYTAMMYAAEKNNPEVVKLLLKAGADASLENRDGLSALDLARRKGYKKILVLLR